MAKRLELGVYGGDARFRISNPGYDVRTCDLRSPIETAFNMDWANRFLNIRQFGTVSISMPEGEEYYRTRLIALERTTDPLFAYVFPKVGDTYFDIYRFHVDDLTEADALYYWFSEGQTPSTVTVAQERTSTSNNLRVEYYLHDIIGSNIDSNEYSYGTLSMQLRYYIFDMAY